MLLSLHKKKQNKKRKENKRDRKKGNLVLLLFIITEQTKTTRAYNSLSFSLYVDMLSGNCSEWSTGRSYIPRPTVTMVKWLIHKKIKNWEYVLFTACQSSKSISNKKITGLAHTYRNKWKLCKKWTNKQTKNNILAE